MKKLIFLVVVLLTSQAQSQIIVENGAPYNTTSYLINNILFNFINPPYSSHKIQLIDTIIVSGIN